MKDHNKTVNDLNLKTGDIVLFSGRCKVARTIKILTLSKWSHAGMIIDDPEHGILSYESTHNDRVPGIDIGRKTQGVQAVKLSDRLEGYEGDIAIMRIEGVEFSKEELDMLNIFRRESIGVKFEEDHVEIFLSMFKWIKNKGSFETRFCTENLGGAYVALGLLDESCDVHKITPADIAKKRIKLKKGFFSDPVLVKKFKGVL